MYEPNILKRIYKKSARLNCYCAMCNPQIERLYAELKDIEKDVKEALDIISKYIDE